MAEFINTIDLLGDDAVTDSIINRTIPEFSDNTLTSVPDRSFANMTLLQSVDLPKVTTMGGNTFSGCNKLSSINMPKLTEVPGGGFNYLPSLHYIKLPEVVKVGNAFNGDWYGYETVDLPKCTSIAMSAFYKNQTTVLILRSPTLCSLGGGVSFINAPISWGSGYIYVPRALLSDVDATKDYRRATNWSNFASQFRVLEDFTVDGTTTGEVIIYNITQTFTDVVSSNINKATGPREYSTTLTTDGDIAYVRITMGGVDITDDVYNAETGEVVIERVSGDIVITAASSIARALIERKMVDKFVNTTAKTIGEDSMRGSTTLVTADLAAVTNIYQNAFNGCTKLSTLILRSGTRCNLSSTNAFTNTLIASTGHIFVPRDLVNSYAAATNWNTYAARIHAIEDVSVDGTVTGEIKGYYLVSQTLSHANSSNRASVVAANGSYRTTLTTRNGVPLETISIIMGDIDVTADVYNAETGEIYIPKVTANLSITAMGVVPDSDTLLLHEFVAANATSTAWVDSVNIAYQFNFTGSPTVENNAVKFTSSSYGILNYPLELTDEDTTVSFKFKVYAGLETWVIGTPMWTNGVIIGGRNTGHIDIDSKSAFGQRIYGTQVYAGGTCTSQYITIPNDFVDITMVYIASEARVYVYCNGVHMGTHASKITDWLSGLIYLNNEGAAYKHNCEVEHIKIWKTAIVP